MLRTALTIGVSACVFLVCLLVLLAASVSGMPASVTEPTPALLVAMLAMVVGAFFAGMVAACLARRPARPRSPARPPCGRSRGRACPG